MTKKYITYKFGKHNKKFDLYNAIYGKYISINAVMWIFLMFLKQTKLIYIWQNERLDYMRQKKMKNEGVYGFFKKLGVSPIYGWYISDNGKRRYGKLENNMVAVNSYWSSPESLLSLSFTFKTTKMGREFWETYNNRWKVYYREACKQMFREKSFCNEKFNLDKHHDSY